MHLRVRHLILLLLGASLLLWQPFAAAQDSPATESDAAEYMIYQYPGMTLVVVIDVREAAFTARINGPEGALVTEAGVPARRVGPVYQYIGPVDLPRQLMVAVRPEQAVERSRISMKLLQFPSRDPNAQRQARAYSLLARGLQRVRQAASAIWAERIQTLRNAAGAFAAMGNEEMQLWSDYYAAHLALHGIGDVLLSREQAQSVQAAARRAGQATIQMLATQLEAESRMAEAARSTEEMAEKQLDRVHPLWEEVAVMAEVLGLDSERGAALYRDGMAYEQQGRLDSAIERYEQALAVLGPGTDQEMLNAVRATAAAAYERSGSASGALGLLEDITGNLTARGEAAMALELAHNLFEKGRLLNDTFRYTEAEAVLERALEVRKRHVDLPEWGPTGLELGRARLALGELDAAARILAEALPLTPRSLTDERYRALGSLAEIAREQARHGEAAQYRERQERVAGDHRLAEYLFESALDARARGDTAPAMGLFRESAKAAGQADPLTAHRARLHLCLSAQRSGRADCEPRRAAMDRQALEDSGLPSLEVEAGLVWIELLQQWGRPADARDKAEQVLDQVQFYRALLPGVISRWFTSSRGRLYRASLRLARGVSAVELLRALERIRQLESVVPRATKPEGAVRTAIHRATSARLAEREQTVRQARQVLQEFREQSGWEGTAPVLSEVRRRLEQLEPDTVLLAFDFSDEQVYAVTASRGEARLHTLAPSADVINRLGEARSVLQTPGADGVAVLERLGADLLAPIADELKRTVLLMPMGPMNGFPLDLLRLKGRYLVERHRVVNIDALASLDSMQTGLSRTFGQQVFLAGNPRAGRELFSYGVSTSRQIDTVRDRFVGSGLHIVQGVALRADEFRDGRYANASLVHLAMPGRVELAWPERSRLLLSGERESPAAKFLDPPELRSTPVRAELVVLAGTSFVARDVTRFASRLGLVHDLHDAGARQVVASLWPLDDDRLADFMDRFYRVLEEEKDVVEALYRTRMSYVESGNESNLAQWAGFQLFIR